MMPSPSVSAEALPHRDLWPGIAGIVSAALLIAGHALWMRTPDPTGDDAAREFVTFYSKSGNQALAEAAALMLFASGLLFMFFLVALSRLAGNRSHLALVGGTVFAVFLMVSGIAGNIYAITADESEVFGVGPRTVLIAILLVNVSYGALIAAMAGAAVMLFALWRMSSEAHATLPRWLGWCGFVIAVLSLAGPITAWGTPLLLGLWMLAAGVVLILKARERDEAEPRAAHEPPGGRPPQPPPTTRTS